MEKPIWKVLVWPGATEIGLEIRQALCACKEVELFSAGARVSSHAPFLFANHFEVPMVGQPGWLDSLKQIIDREGITHVFPAHDDSLLALAQEAGQLGAKLITSPLRTCRITRSKSATLMLLDPAVQTPKLYSSPDQIDLYPVFVKPDIGQGATGAVRANTPQELKSLLNEDPSRIILQYLPGREFTVDCFSDRTRGLLYARGRERRRIRHGIAMDSIFIEDPRFLEMAQKISRQLEFHGAWFFQVKEDAHGALNLMEVAPRVGGTSSLSRVLGVNLPLLSLYEAEGIAVQIQPLAVEASLDRALITRYKHNLHYKALYVDFDDTLVLQDRVNLPMIRLLYQALNQGVRLVLLSRHNGDLAKALRCFRLESIFDEIIHLRNGEPKSDYIKEPNSIFIDDSFSECRNVQARHGIPVFTPSMIDLLLDERI